MAPRWRARRGCAAAAFLRRSIARRTSPASLGPRFALGRKDRRSELERAMEGFRSFVVNRGPRATISASRLSASWNLEDAANRSLIELDTPEIDYHANFGLTTTSTRTTATRFAW
jgi:hypothetical protein